MSTITFTTSVKDGAIEIPEEYKQELESSGVVQVTIVSKKKTAKTGIIAELIGNPIIIKDFKPLTRDEAHARQL